MPSVKRPVPNGCWPRMNEARPAPAALLGIVVREQCTFLCDSVDVARLIAHDPVIVGADIVHDVDPQMTRMLGFSVISFRATADNIGESRYPEIYGFARQLWPQAQ